MSQDEALSMSADLICRDHRESRLFRTMLRRSRVANRHTCVPYRLAYQWLGEDAAPGSSCGPTTQERMNLYATHAGPLALEAATGALSEAMVDPREVSHLITVSCTGFNAPGVDVQLIEDLHLPRTTQRMHIGYMGCHGAINGLRAAIGLAASAPTARILLCATELCSLHYRFQWDDESIIGNALFADGAASLVGGHSDSGQQIVGDLKATGSYLVPDSSDAITWRIGNHGFVMTLASRVPDLIREQLKPWVSGWLDSLGLTLGKIASWAVHPGGPRILDAAQEALGLDDAALTDSRHILQHYGNMSSPTILFILQRLLQTQPGPCVALGFGPGLTIEAALIE